MKNRKSIILGKLGGNSKNKKVIIVGDGSTHVLLDERIVTLFPFWLNNDFNLLQWSHFRW